MIFNKQKYTKKRHVRIINRFFLLLLHFHRRKTVEMVVHYFKFITNPMKRVLMIAGFFFTLFPAFSQQQDLVIEGNYWGKNLYLFNPITNGVSSISKISVNNVVLDTIFNSNSYVVDLTKMNLAMGQTLIISIQHKPNSEPLVTNMDAIAPNKDFGIESFKYNKKDNSLNWSISELEKGKLYDIEQFVWGKWNKVREIGLTDTVSQTSFMPFYHSGLNLFRIKQYEKKSKNTAYTKSLKVRAGTKEVFIVNLKTTKILEFTEETIYEIIDSKGKKVKTGKGKEVDVEKYPKDEYFVNYDNKTEVFIKK